MADLSASPILLMVRSIYLGYVEFIFHLTSCLLGEFSIAVSFGNYLFHSNLCFV